MLEFAITLGGLALPEKDKLAQIFSWKNEVLIGIELGDIRAMVVIARVVIGKCRYLSQL